ncbi:ParB/RepB/Spo0J family partition protein (plasmid) [Burkholderia gladioli]|uniref:ParB/RepB/Spo0J family partition protein n=1 Tax=Burkholderia gladioli TaxID=28095 RepID=UPI001364B01C|nr:ParB/RepB/Spo0J family partition protein [Burkholderia gladioli]KAF1065550.1 Chromosome-partitioning protein Spo0J [Burkholderia gladioli]WAG17836.1 ParB/RepB/Spo0J family partition protein [Burkholderia gladioli]
MKGRRSLDAGFTVAVPAKHTAIDRFAAVDAIVGDDQKQAPHPEPRAIQVTTPDANGIAGSDAFREWCVANNYTPGTPIELPLLSVKASPFNPRHFYRAQSITSLALNIATQGQQQPVHVTPDYITGEGFFIVDGGRRTRALRESKVNSVKAIIVDVPQGIESYKLGYDLNTQHETQTVFDDAVVWKRLLSEGHFANQTALSEQLGVDKSTVTATLSVAELPDALIEAMLEQPKTFGMNMAYAVVKYYRATSEKETAHLVRKIVDEGLSVRKVNDLVRRASDTNSTTSSNRQRYSERVDINMHGNVKVGDLRLYGDDKLRLDLQGLPRDIRDRIQRSIVALLAEEMKDSECPNLGSRND